MNHHDDPRSDDVDDLVGAYVLDAVDDVERRRVERAAAADPALAEEIRRQQLVVDRLADAVAAEPPGGLWDSIAASIEGDASASDTQPAPVRSGSRGRRVDRTFLLVAAAVVAVVAIAGATVVGLTRTDRPTDSIETMTAMANDAARQPGSRTGVLTDPDRTMEVKVVVDREGHGFVMTDVLPSLAPDETYQLWAATDGSMISLGMLGSDPRMSLVPIDATVTELAITREPARGSVSPTSGPMAAGRLA